MASYPDGTSCVIRIPLCQQDRGQVVMSTNALRICRYGVDVVLTGLVQIAQSVGFIPDPLAVRAASTLDSGSAVAIFSWARVEASRPAIALSFLGSVFTLSGW